MRRRAVALWALAALAAAGWLWWRSSTADERAVRKVFARLSELAAKDGPQDGGVLGAATGVAELEELFDERVTVFLPELSRRPAPHARDALVRQAMAARYRASRTALRFDGIRVELDVGRTSARVVGDASLTCVMPGWGSVSDETRELRAELAKDPSDGSWRIGRIELAPILRR